MKKNKFSFLHSKQQVFIDWLRRTGFLSPLMQELANHAAKVFSLSFIGNVLTLITSVVIARTLSKTEFGQFALIGAYLGICSFFQGGGFSMALTQSVARGYHGLYRRTILISFIGTIIGILLVGTITWFTPLRDKIEGFTALFVAAALWPFIIGLGKWPGFLNGKKKFATAKVWNILKGFLSSIAVICAVLIFGKSLIAIVIGFFGAQLLWNLRCSYKVMHEEVKNNSIEPGIMRYGLMTSLYNASSPITQYLDQLIIGTCLGFEEMAIYAISLKIPDFIRLYQREIGNILQPYFATRSKINKQNMKKIWLFLLGYAIITICAALFILPFAIRIVFGQIYEKSILYSQVLLFSLIITMGAEILSRLIMSQKDETRYRNMILGSNIARALLIIFLVPSFGLTGAVSARAIYSIIVFIIIKVNVRKYIS